MTEDAAGSVGHHDPSQTIALIGRGRLSDGLASGLAHHCGLRVRTSSDIADRELVDVDLLVSAFDGWERRHNDVLRAACAEHRVPWVPVWAELGRVVVGPSQVPGTPGCISCVEERRKRNRQDPMGIDAVWERHEDALSSRPSSWLTALSVDTVSSLVSLEVRRVMTATGGLAPPMSQQAQLHMRLDDLRISRHSFLPIPGCEICADALEDDSAESALMSLCSRPKPGPGRYRIRSAAPLREDLIGSYVDDETGLIGSLKTGHIGGLAMAEAALGRRSLVMDANGYGRSNSYLASEATALLEALERYAGLQPLARRPVVRGSFAELSDHAVDPRRLGVYPPERHEVAGFPFQQYDQTARYSWMWGYSFARRAPILVPETIAYYAVKGPDRPRQPFVYECSNGCALGGCLEEAILYGLLEVAERDAFLLTWHARMSVPRLDHRALSGPQARLLVEGIESEGYEVRLYDTTPEYGVPCVWAMAVNRDNWQEDAPKVACTAASHLDPAQALLQGLHELGPALSGLRRRFPAGRHLAKQMTLDDDLVHNMPDHALLYGHEDVWNRLSFLGSEVSGERPAPSWPVIRNNDLRDDLQQAIDRFLTAGLDVIVIDQTAPEHAERQLHCVKVIVPGALPMTFGHHCRRLDLPRLLSVPAQLGFREHPLRPDEVNVRPHPFP